MDSGKPLYRLDAIDIWTRKYDMCTITWITTITGAGKSEAERWRRQQQTSKTRKWFVRMYPQYFCLFFSPPWNWIAIDIWAFSTIRLHLSSYGWIENISHLSSAHIFAKHFLPYLEYPEGFIFCRSQNSTIFPGYYYFIKSWAFRIFVCIRRSWIFLWFSTELLWCYSRLWLLFEEYSCCSADDLIRRSLL